MTRNIMKPSSLSGVFSNWSAMVRDEGLYGAGKGDGLLSRDELKGHIQRLVAERDAYIEASADPTAIEFQIDHSRELYGAMVSAGATDLQYLPDDLMELPAYLRTRATDLLLHDDPTALGKVDQFVIDSARKRYGLLTSVPHIGVTQSKALQEIDELASHLGLE
ncbi:MAG: hypothetical protein HY791_26755 [Deltaproteobacteria bacterium]|nr:hypothetical protein [Deltaproteobacteria bacterium]